MTIRQAAVESMCEARVVDLLEVGPKGQILLTKYSFLASVSLYTSAFITGVSSFSSSSSS